MIALNGGTVQLPDTVMILLHGLTHSPANGQMVALVSVDKELATQQAAEILNVSRPHVVKLLNENEIPFRKIGTHRRIRFDDLMAYKKRRDADRRVALAEIARLGEELDEPDSDS